jgi:hypothetical protein
MAVVFLVRPVDANEQGRLIRSFVHDLITSVRRNVSKLVSRASSGGDLIESFGEPHLSDPFWAKRAGRSEVSAKPLNGR